MKSILIISALLLLISGNALAGTAYDTCIKEEKALKAQEAGDCSGLSYLLNPSACFATQKALREYASGKCKEIDMLENVDPSVQKEKPEKNVNSVCTVKQKKGENEIPQQESTFEQMKEENARLKAEISRLKADNELLKKTDQ